VVADENQLFVAGGKAGQDVRLEHLCSLLYQHHLGTNAPQQFLMHRGTSGRHPHHPSGTQNLTIALGMDILQAVSYLKLLPGIIFSTIHDLAVRSRGAAE